MRVAVVGAGVSGLVSARVLRAVGLDVVVLEERADVGGVWSASRRYPGLGLQSDKGSYSYSDRPMPADYPKYPSGEQVQAYLADYARAHDLDDVVCLRTKVVAASHDDQGWHVEVDGPAGRRTEHADWLVLANGVFSRPHVPDLPGRAEFEAAGGVVLHTSGLDDAERCRGRDVVVLGCGKSATDIAVALSRDARSTTMVARTIGWKLPRKVGRLTFEQLIMTRLGEFVIWAPWRRYRFTRLALRPLAPLRRLLVKRLGRAISEQQDLERRGFLPAHPPRQFNHLETPGFFEAVDDGSIKVVQGTGIASLGATDGRPAVRLDDGSTVAGEVLVAGTGFDQDLGMLDATPGPPCSTTTETCGCTGTPGHPGSPPSPSSGGTTPSGARSGPRSRRCGSRRSSTAWSSCRTPAGGDNAPRSSGCSTPAPRRAASRCTTSSARASPTSTPGSTRPA